MKEIEKWSDNEAIQNYVYDGNLSHHVESLFKYIMNTDLYFVTNNNDLIAIVLTSIHSPINDYDQLLEYVKNVRQENNEVGDISEDFLDIQETNDLISRDNKNILTIEYTVINPDHQGKGIGTMLYKTIKDNIDFFGEYETPTCIQASIHNDNIPSRKTVIKNGFKRIRPGDNNQPYSVYYCRIKNKEDIHSEEKI